MIDREIILIHRKLDAIIEALKASGVPINAAFSPPFPGMQGTTGNVCSSCNTMVSLVVDAKKGEVIRKCGCDIGISSPGPAPSLVGGFGSSYAIGSKHDD